MAEKKRRGPKTKAEKLAEKMQEVTEEAEKYQAEHTEPNLEFPPITLPCRGYFREWDFGDNVSALQTMLNRVMLANVPVTGEYDKETMEAVKLFEQKYGGVVNGKFGREELAAYNKLRGAK